MVLSAPALDASFQETSQTERLPRVILHIDEEFDMHKLDVRPAHLLQPDGSYQRLLAGPVSIAAAASDPPLGGIGHLWREARAKAERVLPPETRAFLATEPFDLTLLVHTGGGDTYLRRMLTHMLQTKRGGKTDAFIGAAMSAGGFLVTGVENWTLSEESYLHLHLSGISKKKIPAETLNPTLQALIESEGVREWLSYVPREVRMPEIRSEDERKFWERVHRSEYGELQDFFERAIRIQAMKSFVRRTLTVLLRDPFSVELTWTGRQLRDLFDLKNILRLCESPSDLAVAFEERTGINLAEPGVEPIRAFFEHVEEDAHA